jgi:hypothetical protein
MKLPYFAEFEDFIPRFTKISLPCRAHSYKGEGIGGERRPKDRVTFKENSIVCY